MDMVMNAMMEPIYRRATARGRVLALPPEFGDIVRGGFVRSGERLFLARPRTKTPPPVKFDAFDAEGWVNKLFLDTGTPPFVLSWRAELLRNGLAVAKRLMPKAVALTELPVQIVISLQSGPDNVDPERDFATGALHLRLVRCAQDDLAVGLNEDNQPVLVLTASASTLAEVPVTAHSSGPLGAV
jgi:hypothetical protein